MRAITRISLLSAFLIFSASRLLAQEASPTFRFTTWGDTKEDVMTLEKEAKLHLDYPGLLIYQDEAHGVSMLIKYFFEGDSLYEANYVVIEDYDYDNYLYGDYIRVREEIISLLGAPVEDYFPSDKEFSSELIKDELRIYSTWDRPRTDVRLQMDKDGEFIYIEVLASSKNQ